MEQELLVRDMDAREVRARIRDNEYSGAMAGLGRV